MEFTLSVYYFVEFTNYAPKHSPTFPGSVWHHIKFIAAIWSASLWIALFFENNVSTVGDLTVILTVQTFASPLAAVKAVVESQSSESIPWPFTLASTLNCILWSIVGVFEMHDVYVALPAILGLFFSLLQVALKLYFGDHHDTDNPTYVRAPVEMPYPVLGSVRQVVMMGGWENNSNNNNLPEHHDLSLDNNNMPTSTSDYMQLGVPLTSGGNGVDIHQQHQQQQPFAQPPHHQQHNPPFEQQHAPPPQAQFNAGMGGDASEQPQFAFAQPSPVQQQQQQQSSLPHQIKHSKSDDDLVETVVFGDDTPIVDIDFLSGETPHPESFRSRTGSHSSTPNNGNAPPHGGHGGF